MLLVQRGEVTCTIAHSSTRLTEVTKITKTLQSLSSLSVALPHARSDSVTKLGSSIWEGWVYGLLWGWDVGWYNKVSIVPVNHGEVMDICCFYLKCRIEDLWAKNPMPAVWKVTNPTLKKKFSTKVNFNLVRLGRSWTLKIKWIDNITNQCFALLLVDKNSVKNQTAKFRLL